MLFAQQGWPTPPQAMQREALANGLSLHINPMEQALLRIGQQRWLASPQAKHVPRPLEAPKQRRFCWHT
jgi:hypothetical protein